MQAFASEPVTTAMQASSTAHMKALAAHKSWDAMARRVLPAADSEGTAAPAVEARQAQDGAKDAIDAARMAAEKADDAVVEAIRAELQGRGKPLGAWQPFPEPDTDVINLT